MHKINTNVTRGKKGEEAAARYLQNKGYTILVRNYRKSFGEIDLIAQEGGTLVFVEVKARASNRFGLPAEAVNAAKQRQLSKVALHYMMATEYAHCPARFDVLSIWLNKAGDVEQIEHLKNAFDQAL